MYLLESQISGSGDTTDGIDMCTPSTADQDANIKNARKIAILTANAVNQVVRFNARLLDYISDVPNFWGLLIRNMSGAAFAASGHDASTSRSKSIRRDRRLAEILGVIIVPKRRIVAPRRGSLFRW